MNRCPLILSVHAAPVRRFIALFSFTIAATALAQYGGISDPTLILSPAPLPLQPPGIPFVDPVFGTTITRVSDTSESGGFETQIYSQLQAFSSDNAYLLLDASNGLVVRRVSDLTVVEGLDASGWNDPRWHPARAHTIIHFDSNDDTVVRLQFTDVDALTTTTVYTFPAQYERIRVPESWDELSEDGRWLGGMLQRNDGESVLFALNIDSQSLGAQLVISELYAGPCEPDPEWGEVEPDWVGVSPLGNYLVVQWVRDGTSRCSGLETYDIETGDFVGRVSEHHNHGDLGTGVDGETEYFMTSELSSPQDNNRPALSVRLLPGSETASPPTYLQVMDWSDEDHFSCRGPDGTALVSWGIFGEEYDWPFENELFLQYVDGSVLRLVHHRSSKCGYWVQPRASISRDGRYVVFASDWGEETGTNSCDEWNDPMGRGDPYIIDLQSGTGAELEPIPGDLLLLRLLPNPTSSVVRVEYRLSRTELVAIKLLDLQGRELFRMNEGQRIRGLHMSKLDLPGIPAGTYSLVLQTPTSLRSQRLVLLHGS